MQTNRTLYEGGNEEQLCFLHRNNDTLDVEHLCVLVESSVSEELIKFQKKLALFSFKE